MENKLFKNILYLRNKNKREIFISERILRKYKPSKEKTSKMSQSIEIKSNPDGVQVGVSQEIVNNVSNQEYPEDEYYDEPIAVINNQSNVIRNNIYSPGNELEINIHQENRRENQQENRQEIRQENRQDIYQDIIQYAYQDVNEELEEYEDESAEFYPAYDPYYYVYDPYLPEQMASQGHSFIVNNQSTTVSNNQNYSITNNQNNTGSKSQKNIIINNQTFTDESDQPEADAYATHYSDSEPNQDDQPFEDQPVIINHQKNTISSNQNYSIVNNQVNRNQSNVISNNQNYSIVNNQVNRSQSNVSSNQNNSFTNNQNNSDSKSNKNIIINNQVFNDETD